MALALSRYPGESIELTGGIKITIVRIIGYKVRLAIEAPKEVIVLRSEVKTRQGGSNGRTEESD